MASMNNAAIVSQLQLRNGLKTFRFAMDLKRSVGGGDENANDGPHDDGDQFGNDSSGFGDFGGDNNAGFGTTFRNADLGSNFGKQASFGNDDCGHQSSNVRTQDQPWDEEYQFSTILGSNTKFSWKVIIDYGENPKDDSIGLELLESPYPRVFAVYRLRVCGKRTGEKIWETTGVRVFSGPRDDRDDPDAIPFIDEDEQPSKDIFWLCGSLRLDDDDGFTLHCILDVPADYGTKEFRAVATSKTKPVVSVYGENTFSFISSLFDHVQDPLCPLTDVTLVVIDSMYRPQRFYCHRLVLSAHSSVFAEEFRSPLATNSNVKTITGVGGRLMTLYPMNTCRGFVLSAIAAFIRYFYTGRVEFRLDLDANDDGRSSVASGTVASIDVLIQLTKLASDFGVNELITRCENRLIGVCDDPFYRMPLAMLAGNRQLPRLKRVLLSLMAGVQLHLEQCSKMAIFGDLVKETEQKMFVAVEKLN